MERLHTPLGRLVAQQQDLLDRYRWRPVTTVSRAILRQYGASSRHEPVVAGARINYGLALYVLERTPEAILQNREVINREGRYPTRLKQRAKIARTNMTAMFADLAMHAEWGDHLANVFPKWEEHEDDVRAAGYECLTSMKGHGETKLARKLRRSLRVVFNGRRAATRSTRSHAELQPIQSDIEPVGGGWDFDPIDATNPRADQLPDDEIPF